MLVQGVLHRREAVLQTSHHIVIFADGDTFVVVTFRDALYLPGQAIERMDGMGDGNDGEHQDQEQSGNGEGQQHIVQTVVTLEDTAHRTDECQTPLRARHRLVADETGFTIDHHFHIPLMSCRHLMA